MENKINKSLLNIKYYFICYSDNTFFIFFFFQILSILKMRFDDKQLLSPIQPYIFRYRINGTCMEAKSSIILLYMKNKNKKIKNRFRLLLWDDSDICYILRPAIKILIIITTMSKYFYRQYTLQLQLPYNVTFFSFFSFFFYTMTIVIIFLVLNYFLIL